MERGNPCTRSHVKNKSGQKICRRGKRSLMLVVKGGHTDKCGDMHYISLIKLPVYRD